MKLVVEEYTPENDDVKQPVSKATPTSQKTQPPRYKKKKHTKRRIVLFVMFTLTSSLLFFLAPLVIGYGYLGLSIQSLRKGDLDGAKKYVRQGKPYSVFSTQLYGASRPVLSFFFLGFVFDNPLSIQQTSYQLAETGINALENISALEHDVVSTEPIHIDDTKFRIAQLNEQLPLIQDDVQELSDQLTYHIDAVEKLKINLSTTGDFLSKTAFLVHHLDEILGSNGTKKYLIYFYNNMELRPGGGFIGSLATITFDHFKLTAFDIHDVYDIDGQLQGHIEPPIAISKYMSQPHWFLRDSNFSPDFEKNIETGAYFLEKTGTLPSDYDGVFAITTSAVAYLLEGFHTIHLDEYNETITKDNFYIKTQLSVEDNFFPGSIQKKSFLSSLAKTMLLKLDTASLPALAKGLERSLIEKHIVMHFKDPTIQKDIEQTGWHGKVMKPICFSKNLPCISDYLLAIDANLGANKTNYYVSRSIVVQPTLNENGSIKNTVYVTFKNASPLETFPGGNYNNFFRLYLPQNAQVESIIEDSNSIQDPSIEQTTENTYVQLYISIAPKAAKTVQIVYTLPQVKFDKKGVYQLIVQKQIGSINTDLSLSFLYPKTLLASPDNFQALAKGRSFSYNTSLANDRIFIITFTR